MSWTTCYDHDVDFDGDDGCPVCLVKAELTAAHAEIAKLRADLADLANAGAVMVEAARVLLADPDTPDGFRGYILNRRDMDTTMSGYAEGAMDYLRALAEQEKADG